MSEKKEAPFRASDYCADPLIYLFLTRWHLPAILIPLFLSTLVTLLEFASAIPNHLVIGRDGIIGILDDPAFYYSNWLGGGGLWLYYVWMGGGIHTMFGRLRENGAVKIKDTSKVEEWENFIQKVKSILGSWKLSVAALVIALIAGFGIYFPSIRHLNNFAAQSLYGQLLVSSWISIILYAVIQIVVRQIIVTIMLARMFRQFQFNILPLHPDGAGGLAPLGSFALKSSYIIAVVGFIVVFAAFNRQYVASGTFGGILVTRELLFAAAAYLIFAPVIFLAPLATAHRAMNDAKNSLLLELSRAFEVNYHKTFEAVTRPGEGQLELERLREIRELHQMIEKFPVWPFNASTLQRFFASLLSPIILALLPNIITILIGK